MTPPAEQSPTTEAGRALDNRLAFDASPEGYLPGDYLREYRAAILAIEAEARATPPSPVPFTHR